ncbi:Hypothetical protein BHY_0950 (plasmid) [Borrelia nietonii YOR]|uniref:Uncharacterized protein n=1 Tax=Borrelia nietonii YOR TaxID=1293576 RepID=W5SFL3_9SPIR|nr:MULTISPECIES: DUF228 domain-containing protein [Borrelia]AHH03901.1 Hypothetical protein BHY_0950 [Borrelia nietonii YOR]AHH14347.1 Hypothetical protein BHW_0122700 [Borrelia hermsii MTW]UPA09620.1 DUF228 domain-containing protein [Borrelia nietonii YOR]UPA09684.1 DUF228 domain-containing protein [Borrelia nietonii YOR]UPA09723.1 DUF228 domain-containing protein [Borrelia nietonii YOR]
MSNVTQLVKQYEDKAKELKKLMKNPTRDAGTFSNTADFRNKNLHFSNSGGTVTSRHDKFKNYFFKGYPYKRGVKLVVDTTSDNSKPHYEPHVEAGGEDDLYGICTDIDEFTQTATVIPITNSFQGYLVAKDNSIKRKDKLKFNSDGQVEKNSSSNNKISVVALSDSIELDSTEKKLYVVHVAVYGNKGKPS